MPYCRKTNVSFQNRAEEEQLLEFLAPTFNGKKYAFPHPTLCPASRYQRRLSFRNERTYYQRSCDLTGKMVISLFQLAIAGRGTASLSS